MALQLPAAPIIPPPPVLTCAGCHRVCDPSDDLRTTTAVYAVCSDCWEAAVPDPVEAAYRAWLREQDRALAHQLAKNAKSAFLAALERRVLDGE